MEIQGQAGIQFIQDGSSQTLRMTKLAALVVQELHGRYYEQAYRKNTFYAGNTAATTTSVALATTYLGLCLSNPAGSSVNLALLSTGCVLAAAPAAASTFGLITGFATTGVTAHTTPLIPASTFIGGPRGTGMADAAATIVGTPAWTMQFAQFPITTEGTAIGLMDIAGQIILPPGAYAAIGTLTAVSILGHFVWEEVAV